MKGSTIKLKNNRLPKPNERVQRMDPAVEELLTLYRAWLAYLLWRLGQSEFRVPAADITKALDALRCEVTREGEDYIIHMTSEGREVTPGESTQP